MEESTMFGSLVYNLQNLSYRYSSNKTALNQIDLKIGTSERIMLLGPNGCGKSTLQKILAGLIFATSGTLTAFDRKISASAMKDKTFSAAFRRKVGFVFQNSDVQLFCSSVLDEIMFGPIAMGLELSLSKKRAHDLLAYCDIASLAQDSPHHLSGGEKKKVAIAAVLASNPDVLIFDEPTNGLDPKSQRWILNTINDLNRQGKTIILATHQLGFVPEIADRVIVLGDDHEIVAEGLPQDILNNRNLLIATNLVDPRYQP
jgi:cobalt/nickel transport system ATP-binding protein